MLFIINYDCIHWCGGDSHCVVVADTEDEAIEKASDFMEEAMKELFADEIEDEGFGEDETYANVNSVEVLNEKHEVWAYYKDPSQRVLYPHV